MMDSTVGFTTQSAEEPTFILQFCGEGCKAFSDCSHVSLPSLSVKKPLKEVTFSLVPSDSNRMPNSEVESIHLLSITRSSRDERNQRLPTHAAIDVYKVKEGNDHLPSGCFVAIFELRTYNNRTFGEFFLTDQLQLGKPLPHVKIQVDQGKSQLFNDMLQEGVLMSGHDVDHIRSLGLHDHELLAQETTESGSEDENLDVLPALYFS